jgi:hypothetical protein
VLRDGADGPGRYPSGGGERGLPGCHGAAFVVPWLVDEQRQRRVSLSFWSPAKLELRGASL